MQVTSVRTSEQVNPEPGVTAGTACAPVSTKFLGRQNSQTEGSPPAASAKLGTRPCAMRMRISEPRSSKDLAFSRAGEWMLDNFYVVEQTLHQIEEDLPESYYDQLPKLDNTCAKGIPAHFWIGLGMDRIQPESDLIWLKLRFLYKTISKSRP